MKKSAAKLKTFTQNSCTFDSVCIWIVHFEDDVDEKADNDLFIISTHYQSISNSSICDSHIWIVHFKDNVDMKVTLSIIQTQNSSAHNSSIVNTQAQKHIQKLQAKVAQYEQEKLRLKKKDKKIEQMKLCCQDHD